MLPICESRFPPCIPLPKISESIVEVSKLIGRVVLIKVSVYVLCLSLLFVGVFLRFNKHIFSHKPLAKLGAVSWGRLISICATQHVTGFPTAALKSECMWKPYYILKIYTLGQVLSTTQRNILYMELLSIKTKLNVQFTASSFDEGLRWWVVWNLSKLNDHIFGLYGNSL